MDRKLRIMVIGAHPDDCDFQCGGLALKYLEAGHTVKFLSMCNGSGGHQTMTSEETAARRYGEMQAVAKYAGLEYEVWDVEDCELMADLETRKRLVRCIRKFNPDMIFACRSNDYHADHRNCGVLVQDASYLLIVPHFCPDVPAMKEMPVIMHYYDRFQNPPFRADVVVSIDDVYARKVEMESLHTSQMFEWLPYTHGTLAQVPEGKEARLQWMREPTVPRDKPLDESILSVPFKMTSSEVRNAIPTVKYRDKLVERYGEEAGMKVLFSEALCLCEYGKPLTQEAMKEFFPF